MQKPFITFAIAAFNEKKRIRKCIDGIQKQNYPKNRVEILVVDGGSTDGTLEDVNALNIKILNNPKQLAEPGLALAYLESKSDYMVFMAADNILFDKEWLNKMLKPLITESPKVVASFSKVVNDPSDNVWNKFINEDQDPFSAFVFGNCSHPSKFNHQFPIIKSNMDYVVYDYDIKSFPLIALAQCTILKVGELTRNDFEYDDILPLINLIKNNKQIAYVKNTGLYHYSINSFSHFVRKFNRRIFNSMKTSSFKNRDKYNSRIRKIKRYLFLLYSLLLFPLIIHSIFLVGKYKKAYMFLQIPASLALSYLILYNLFIIYIWKK